VGGTEVSDAEKSVPSPIWPTLRVILAPTVLLMILLLFWDRGVAWSGTQIFPGPWAVAVGITELAREGLLLRYTISSLYRVTWGFFLAVAVGIPFGLTLGWFARAYEAFNPLIQLMRPISPIAWIPLSILWFGVSETAPIFLIFLASVFPITVSAIAAVKNIPTVYVRAARNFGLSRWQLFQRVIFPATLPQILTGLRLALGIAWLVVVAAEMIVVSPQAGGLGYLIIDARNAGSRYDLVVAGMVLIGIIGLMLDLLIRQLEKLDEVRWGYEPR
jgi:NitT/TauT family transport system permease protein